MTSIIARSALHSLMQPSSVALIGASDQADSLGTPMTRHLLDQSSSVQVHLVNRHRAVVFGRPCLERIEDLPTGVDLAVLLTPWAVSLDLLEALERRGVGAAVVVSVCGRGRVGISGHRQDLQRLKRFRSRHRLRVIGPGSQGIILPRLGLNLSLCPATPEAGSVGFLSTSGAIASVIADWAENRGLGMSALLSLGDAADVDLADALEWFAADAGTRALLLYLEHCVHPRRLFSALRNLALRKPVVVLAPDAVTDAQGDDPASMRAPLLRLALERAGALCVDSLEEFCAAANVDLPAWPHAGSRFAIAGNGPGLSRLASNAVHRAGGRLAELTLHTRSALQSLLPEGAAASLNPLDLGRDADGPRYAGAAAVLAADEDVDVVLLCHHPTSFAAPAQVVAELEPSAEDAAPLLAAFAGAGQDRSRYNLARRGIAAFETPEAAVHAYSLNRRHYAQRTALLRTRPPLARHLHLDLSEAERLLDGNGSIDAVALLACAGITLKPAQPAAGQSLLLRADALLGPLLEVLGTDARPRRQWLLPLDGLSADEVLDTLGVADSQSAERLRTELLALAELYQRCPELGSMELQDPHWSADGWLAAAVHCSRSKAARAELSFAPCPPLPHESIELADLPPLLLRSIRAEDEAMLQRSFDRLSAEEVRMRFLYPMAQMSHELAARLTQLDHDREIALVLADPTPPGHALIHAVVRASFDLGTRSAEFAIVIHRQCTRRGLGRRLMERIIERCRAAGMLSVHGLVLPENHAMLALADRLGFVRSRDEELIRVSLSLQPESPA